MTVYLIENRINGKGYVGITVAKLSARWSKHKPTSAPVTVTMLALAERGHSV